MNIHSFSLSLGLNLVISTSLILPIITPVQAQTGNQSDQTGANITTSSQSSGLYILRARGGSIINLPLSTANNLATLEGTSTTFNSTKIANNVMTLATEILNSTTSVSGQVIITTQSGQNVTITVPDESAKLLVALISKPTLVANTFPQDVNDAISSVFNIAPNSRAKISPEQVLQLINSNTPAGNFLAAILLPLSAGGNPSASAFTGANNSIAANAAVLAVALQGLATNGNVNPAQFVIAVRAFNAFAIAANNAGLLNLMVSTGEFNATRAVLSKLIDAAKATL